jgi:site-specific DNA recombinase
MVASGKMRATAEVCHRDPGHQKGKFQMAHRSYRRAQVRMTLGYCRVSTDDQAQHGVSIDAQESKIVAYCTAMEFPEPENIRDAGASAKSLQRPGMTALLERIRRGEVERIIVTKLDRLTRSVRDLADLVDLCAKHDVALVSIGETIDTGTAAGRMVVNMLGTVAQWEREVIAERTSSALAHKRQNGEAYGPTPYGFSREGNRFVSHPSEQKILCSIRDMRARGISFNRIAASLNADGLRTRCGGSWYATSIHSILTSKAQIAA